MKNIQCKNCHKTFKIFPEDEKFYNSMNVNEPTLCPDCRQQRRCTWRNERNLYKRKCDYSGKGIISMYAPNSDFPVYDQEIWFGDKWDPLAYGQDFDFSKTFFTQFKELISKVPRLSLYNLEPVNSYYNNHCFNNKNCYMNCDCAGGEEVLYSKWVIYLKSSSDCSYCFDSELIYDCVDVRNCYNCISCQLGEKLNDCYLCYDCKGCSNCLFCTNLRNQKYCIFNQPVSAYEFKQKIEQIFSSPTTYQNAKAKFDIFKEKAIHKYTVINKSENCTGNYLEQDKNVFWSFDARECENSKFIFDSNLVKDGYDTHEPGFGNSEKIYEIHAGPGISFSAFCHLSGHGHHMFYCDQCLHSSYLLGCISLQKKKYCILNKQYNKEDYYKLKNKIIKHMKTTGEWGEFFPIALSPFAYNESVASLYYPMKREDVKNKGWHWREELPSVKKMKKAEGVYTCKQCSKHFLLVDLEKKLYQQIRIPRPNICHDCRYKNRMKLRNPRSLWNQRCMCTQPNHTHHGRCPNEFETTYSSERKELVYCEDCYNREIY